MSKELKTKEISESLDNISKFIKGIAHPKRLQILVLMLEEPQDFSTLLKKTNLKKTALSNHLSQLMENSLIEKPDRGNYHISMDGKELLQATATVYKDSKSREKLQREKISKRYSNLRVNMMEKTEKLVSQEPVFQGAWVSYIGAVLGVLQSMGNEKNIDRADIGGYTGYAFALPNVSKRDTCPSGPTALAVWPEIVKATGSLGFKVREYVDYGGLPEADEVTDEDRIRAKELFHLIKKAIDKDKPVILWGLNIPEYGIVKGYIGDSYIVSAIPNHLTDTKIRYDDLHSPGSLHAIFFGEDGPDITKDVDQEAIGRAIKFSEGKIVHDNYIASPTAYDVWAKNLENESEDVRPYHGNSYNGECNLEAKTHAQVFTKRLSQKYQGKPQAKYLDEASQMYFKIIRRLGKFQRIFPFAMDGDMSQEKRFEGAELLRAVVQLEMQANTLLKESYDVWV